MHASALRPPLVRRGGEMRFAERVVLITGAASGFGRLAAERFAGEGAKLSLSDISEDRLAETADLVRSRGGDVVTSRVDVSDEADIAQQVQRTLEHYGQLDVAINNAGVGHALARLPDLPVEEFDRVMAINARGVFLGMKYQLPTMVERGEGAILNVASAAGVVGAGMLAAYAASKHAVVGLTRTAADEFARKNVRINALCPSFAVTPLFNDMADEIATARQESRSEAYSRITQRIPMRRVAEPEEVVQAMLWICSPENSFMTGQAISIDGGLTAV